MTSLRLVAHPHPALQESTCPHAACGTARGIRVPCTACPSRFARYSPPSCGSCVLLSGDSRAPCPLCAAVLRSESDGAAEAPDTGGRDLRALALSRSPSHPCRRFPWSRCWTTASSGRARFPTLPAARCGSPTRYRLHSLPSSSRCPRTAAEGGRLLRRLAWAAAGVGCPLRPGRTGDHCPVG